MIVNGIEIGKNTHKDVIRAMVHHLIEIACEDNEEEAEYYKNFNPKKDIIDKKVNQHASDVPVSK